MQPNVPANSSNCSTKLSHYYPLFTATYSVVMVVGLPLNGAALWAFMFRLGLRTVPVIYMANLALSDLLFTLSLPFRVLYFSMGHWPFSNVACRISGTLFSVNMYSSSFFIGLIGVDRMLALCYPLRARHLRTKWVAWAASGAVWLAILVIAVPVALNHPANVDECGIRRCFENYSKAEWRFGFSILCLLTVTGIGFPFAAVLCSTVSVVRLLRAKQASGRVLASHRVIWFFVVNLLIYIICFIPFHVAFILLGLDRIHNKVSRSFDVQTVTMCLASTNSCIDPIIYYYGAKSLRHKDNETLEPMTTTW